MDTIWTLECDHVVDGIVTIQFGFTLTILPGTIVKFNNQAGLSVFGTLRARGGKNNRVIFTSNDADTTNKLQGGDWEHIIFEDSSTSAVVDESGNYLSGSIIQNAVVEYAVDGIISRTSTFIDSNIIRNNSGTGITGGGDIRITNNTIADNANGGLSIGVGNVTISGNTITDNVATLGGALYLDCRCIIHNNVIARNLATSDHGGGGINSGGGLKMYLNDIYDNRSGSGGGTRNDFTNRLPAGSPDVDVQNNWWGTTTPASIEGYIWHSADEPGTLGVVDYDPILNTPVFPGAPVFPKRHIEAARLTLFRYV